MRFVKALTPHARIAHSLAGAPLLLALAGCAVDTTPAFRDVDATVFERTGHHVQWNQGTEDDRKVAEAIQQRLSRELTADAAVEVALLNNRGLQATLERIGIAQADLVQAGLLKNPEFAASWRFPDHSPRQVDAEYAVSQDFLDLVILPLRKKFAAAELERTKLTVADTVLALTAGVKIAFYTVQAQEQLLRRLTLIQEFNQAASELAQRQHDAGTLNDLDLANQQAVYAQSTLEVTQARITLKASREKLNRLLGLWGRNTQWTVAQHLPEIPAGEVPLEHLETLAVRQRLDLAASRQAVEAIGKSLGITEDFRYLSTIKIGVDTEHNPGGPTVTGPTLALELPIFDQGQARIATLQSRYRQARQELIAQAITIRSEVREVRERLLAQRELSLYYGKTLLPQRIAIVNLTQLHYNAMLKGTYDLLLAKQNEVATERAYVDSLRDYWIARAELERAVGGRVAAPATTQASTAPAVPTTASTAPMSPAMHMPNTGDTP